MLAIRAVEGETVVVTIWPSHEVFDAWIARPERAAFRRRGRRKQFAEQPTMASANDGFRAKTVQRPAAVLP